MVDDIAEGPATSQATFESVLTDSDVALMMSKDDMVTQATYLTNGREIAERLDRYQRELNRLDEVKSHIARTRKIVRAAPISPPRDFSAEQKQTVEEF